MLFFLPFEEGLYNFEVKFSHKIAFFVVDYKFVYKYVNVMFSALS